MTLLTDPPGNPEIARALDRSGRGVSLLFTRPLPLGAAVRIDQSDALLLGEVVHCRAEPDGSYRIGVAVDQSLRHTRDLEALRRSIQNEQPVEPQPQHSREVPVHVMKRRA